MAIELTSEQKAVLKKYIKNFKEYVKTVDFREDLEDRKKRETLFRALTPEKINSLTEYEFGNIISILWASRIWGNKEYLVQNIITQNDGLEKIKSELHKLLFGKESVEARFDSFKVAGMGPAMITEILCYFNPNKYGIWNDRARRAMKILGFNVIVPVGKYKISGNEYNKFNNLLKSISNELKLAGFEADLLLVDYFLYRIPETKEAKMEEPIPVAPQEFDHDEVRDKIAEIGSWLGFESETEKAIAPGARVDVVWRVKIGNLGTVRYVFEAHKGGAVDSLILNLQKAKQDPTVQKIIAVSSKPSLEKIEKEAAALPEFRKSLILWDASEVYLVHQHLSEIVKSIEKLGLVEKAGAISMPSLEKTEIPERGLLHIVKGWESKYGFIRWGAKEEAKYLSIFSGDRFEVVFLGRDLGKRKPDFKHKRIFITRPLGIPPGGSLLLRSKEGKLIVERA